MKTTDLPNGIIKVPSEVQTYDPVIEPKFGPGQRVAVDNWDWQDHSRLRGGCPGRNKHRMLGFRCWNMLAGPASSGHQTWGVFPHQTTGIFPRTSSRSFIRTFRKKKHSQHTMKGSKMTRQFLQLYQITKTKQNKNTHIHTPEIFYWIITPHWRQFLLKILRNKRTPTTSCK